MGRLSKFQTIVPVFHQKEPLAYLLLSENHFDELSTKEHLNNLRFIQTLANIIVVAIENKRMNLQHIKQVRLKKELEVASEMQKMLFPSSLPSNKQMDLSAKHTSRHQVGGDYYDFIPLNEDEFWVDEPYKAYFGYGWMRRYREKLMEHVSKFSNMEIALARGTAIYGPNDNFNPKTCHVVPALIKRVLDGEDPFIVWGTADVVRDFLYVKDVVKAALLVLEKGESMRPYNVGSGVAITVEDIVNAILKATNKNPKVIYDASKPTTIPFRMVSTERLNNELGFAPDYTFEEGIKETVEWYIKNKI